MSPRQLAGLGLAYGALAVVYTWPLAASLTTHLPHDLGDPLLSSWILWWHAHRVPFTREWWDGLAFFPVHGGLAFSDHRVGLSLLTSPLQWLGCNDIGAYNTALLASFTLSGIAAHALGHALTGRHAAAWLAGLIFAFNPFRLQHVAHLEIVSSYWVPVALLALHRWQQSARRRWLVLFGVAWTLQGLTSGYYFFYLAVLTALWMAWFLTGRRWRQWVPVVATAVVATVPMAPGLLKYWQVHREFGLRRDISEIERFSADITGLLSGSPLLSGWSVLDALARPEGNIFPGFVAVAIVGAVALTRVRASHAGSHTWPRKAALWLAALSGGVALSVVVAGPWRVEYGPVRLSVSDIHKPLSIAVASVAAWGLTSAAFIRAWQRQSIFVFYATATAALWLLSFGPAPTFLGRQVLYKAPYSWLMWLPGFDGGLRAPARFAMVAALCLGVAAAAGLHRSLARHGRRRAALVCTVLAVLVYVESVPRSFPLARVPEPTAWPAHAPADAAVLELPLGDGESDARAVYESTRHRRRVVNGFSGYDPPHYALLRLALQRRDPAALGALASDTPLLVAVRADRRAWEDFLMTATGTQVIGRSDGADFFVVPRQGPGPVPSGPGLAVGRVVAQVGSARRDVTRLLTDGRLDTIWSTEAAQSGGERLVLRLSAPGDVCGLRLAQGPALGVARTLVVEAHTGSGWRRVWSGPLAGMAVAGALRDPRRVESAIAIPPQVGARRLRLRQVGRDARNPWFVAELGVAACASPLAAAAEAPGSDRARAPGSASTRP